MNYKKKLVAVLACRNDGARLYGKPLQNLDISKGHTILDNLVDGLKTIGFISDIVLGISRGSSNRTYIDFAKKKKIKFIIGDEVDVLSRLVKCGKKSKASDILRASSESPFLFYEVLHKAWRSHSKNNYDFTAIDDVVDGIGFEIINMKTLIKSHKLGEKRHRSELCSLYIREHIQDFKCQKIAVSNYFIRKDLRLTVDYPEDLILCRKIYEKFKKQSPKIKIKDIINFLDKNKKLIDLTKKYSEEGYKTMNIWKN